MAFKGFQLPPVFEADDVIRKYRPLGGHERRLFFRHRRRRFCAGRLEGRKNLVDQRREALRGNLVFGDMGGDDLGGELE